MADAQLVRKVAKAIHAGNHTGWVLVRKKKVVATRGRQKAHIPNKTLIAQAAEMSLEGFEKILANCQT